MGGWEAVPYEPGLRETWDALVRGARARHFLFERGYLEYHADRFTDASLLLLRDGRPAAALPASRHGEQVVSHGGLTFGALLSDASVGAAQTVAAFACVMECLRAAGARRWIYKPVPHVYHLLPAEEDLYALALHGARLVRRDVSAARPAGAEVAYSSERARAVRRGRGAALELRRSHDWEPFVALLREILHARHDAEPIHTASELALLAERFPDGIALHAAYDAGGELVAGVVVYETPAVAHCQYIAASDRGRELRAQDALFDQLLTDVYASKPWFDFGTSMRPDDGTLNEGLIRNKEGFGARAVVYDRWAVEL
jgi:hypothetical protein